MTSREAFEAWYATTKENADKNNPHYAIGMNALWPAWQAATERAAQICDERASVEGIAQECAAAIRAR